MDFDTVPAALRDRLGTEASAGLLTLLEGVQDEWESDVMDTSAHRYERRLAEETSKLRVEMTQGFAAIRQELATGLAALRQEIAKGHVELRTAMTDQKFEILKWVFLFWTGQFFVTASFVVMVIRAFK